MTTPADDTEEEDTWPTEAELPDPICSVCGLEANPLRVLNRSVFCGPCYDDVTLEEYHG